MPCIIVFWRLPKLIVPFSFLNQGQSYDVLSSHADGQWFGWAAFDAVAHR